MLNSLIKMKRSIPLKVSLHGMNDRMQKLMVQCLNTLRESVDTVVVVADDEALVEIIDSPAPSLLEEHLARNSAKPIIVISLHEVISDEIIYIKKPVQSSKLLEALQAAEGILNSRPEVFDPEKPRAAQVANIEMAGSKNIDEYVVEISRLVDSSDFIDHPVVQLDEAFDFENMPDDNRRKRVRYAFDELRGYFETNSFLMRNKRRSVQVMDISSKGAFIECDDKLKLKSKGNLVLEFGLATVFIIPVQVVRVQATTYGLLFKKYNHELSDYLINSGRSFTIRGGEQAVSSILTAKI